MTPTDILLFVDGASRNNPGPAGAGIHMTNGDNTLFKNGYYLGTKTNNQAEYLALLIALLIVKNKFGNEKVSLKIFSDSELLVRQINGTYSVKNADIAKIKALIDKILKDISYAVTHVVREKNKIADKLANEGIDKKIDLPAYVMEFLREHDIEI